ncbi:ectonucleoside triphosphate diphosphohydrolase 5-like isoform X2 [Solea solea]|uniref:ectonucleoside triphosphate diphosphohydrolase 5-like isoform X2 n=1 Tax=Solea solea TaxID=90069 RepID=UPI00272AB012|nr:ectonucleoside triphosphate diphosphohydrolase 5-like isoform X2 [Solea solea]
MKMKPTVPLLLLVLLTFTRLSRAQVRTSLLDLTNNIGGVLPSLSRPANHSRIFYAVMFDAGSTGTRIHVYTFIQSDSEKLPVLDNEMFHSIKPGLSAYADSPEMAGHTVRLLLKVAKRTVPRLEWKRTPVVLRATAGLRLLAAEKSQALLDQVQHVFDESPFLVPDNSVTIMNGTNEGILAWMSLNFLTGHLNAQTKKTVGILDLGGGSTQITFLPKLQKTIESVPVADYIVSFDIFNSTFQLYTYSYLGNGLMAARLATLGALGAEGLEWRIFKSSCLPKKFRDEWSFGGLIYQVSGDPEGETGFKLCYQEVLKVVKDIIHQPYELQDSNVFYAFSYYFDRAVDAGLIGGDQGGRLEVRDFKKRAKEDD